MINIEVKTTTDLYSIITVVDTKEYNPINYSQRYHRLATMFSVSKQQEYRK